MWVVKWQRVFPLSLLTALLAFGCSDKETSAEVTTVDTETSSDAGAPASDAGPVYTPPICPPENKFCAGASTSDTPAMVCGEQPIDLTPSGVNVMIAVDGSYAMRNHWPVMQKAVKQMLEQNPDINFGAHLFWANASDLQMVFEKLNFCGSTENRVLDVGPDQHQAVLDWFGPNPPGPGGQYFSLRPVVDPLRYYLEHDTQFGNERATNYLVFISNGDDNCFGHAFAAKQDKDILYEKLATELLKKNIRTLPIGFDGATAQRTFTGNLRTNFESLDRLAKHGGTGLDKALAADSSEELEQALTKVTESIRTCRFKIPDVLDPAKNLNPFELTFLINGTKVPRDRTHHEGWDFFNGDTSEVETFGDACVAIQAGEALEARLGCSGESVCGTAASRVTAKGRAVEYMVDRSFSMAFCEVPDLFGAQCITDYGNTLSWWGLAARSIARSVTSTINDDVEFGLYYFPRPGDDGCGVSEDPEVPITESSEVAIIGSLLANLATGSTPLVRGLETVAMKPGRLVDPSLSSAIILISDGGNACDGLTQEETVQRLGMAAKALYDQGVKVYAVRFGAKDDAGAFAAQDAQLRAIVAGGGTATGDPNDPDNVPYLDAPDQEQLDKVLGSISEQLASCDFEVGDAGNKADKDKVNLYINGEVIPFDSKDEKADGWGWADDGRTLIRMYGDACTRFKNSRATSIVVEFGCVPEILL